MQRYFVDVPFNEAKETMITGDNARHMVKVMRMVVGDQIIAVHNNTAHICDIITLDQDVTVRQTGETISSPELPIHVDIACGLPKGDKLDLITQKGTELGMHALFPFAAERSIVKWDEKKGDKKTERLQKIAQEAAEQSHRTHVPEIMNPVSFKQLLAQIPNYDAVFIADEEDAKAETRSRFADKLKKVYDNDYKSILCIFGPEGGISRKESAALLAAGAQTMSLRTTYFTSRNSTVICAICNFL